MRILWVFSLGVNGDELAEDTLANIHKTQELCKKQRFDAILLTGGIFEPGQTVPISHLMRDELKDVGIELIVADDSTITRHDVIMGVEALAKRGVGPENVQLTVVSERWHLNGILLLLLHHGFRSFTSCPSGYLISFSGIIGRCARIALYSLDPLGEEQARKITA